jgi:hypothetical protein
MVESYANNENFDESNYFRKPCRYFTRFGFCLEPDTCEYNHTKQEPISAPYVVPWNLNPVVFVPKPMKTSSDAFVPKKVVNQNPSNTFTPIDFNHIPQFPQETFSFPEFDQVEQPYEDALGKDFNLDP